MYGRNVLITGASSGIGLYTAETLAKEGFHVYGVSRHGSDFYKETNNTKSFSSEGFIKMLTMDVTDEESIAKGVKQVLDEAGSIDILINAAGKGICGAVDECDFKSAFAQFDTNYFGTMRLIGAVVPTMRKARNGLVVNVGSVGGIFPVPFQSTYSSSKFAIEAMTECMRIELKPFNVKATLIEPGDIKTGFTAARKFAKTVDESDYGLPYKRAIAQMEKDEQTGASPQVIANAILKVIKKKKPPVRTVVGGMYKFFVFLKRILPASIVEILLTAMYPESKIIKE